MHDLGAAVAVLLVVAVSLGGWWWQQRHRGGDWPRGGSPVGIGGERLFNGRVLLEHAAEEIRAETGVDAAELGVVVAATGDLLQVLTDASGRLEVRAPEVPDLAAMHAWSLRLLDRGTRRRRGMLRMLR